MQPALGAAAIHSCLPRVSIHNPDDLQVRLAPHVSTGQTPTGQTPPTRLLIASQNCPKPALLAPPTSWPIPTAKRPLHTLLQSKQNRRSHKKSQAHLTLHAKVYNKAHDNQRVVPLLMLSSTADHPAGRFEACI